jgi:hypothetical protein
MSRWTRFFIAILVGVALGLLYGWVFNPVEYVDTTPDSLREDYKADYVLMVAEIYQRERDPALAAARLMFLGEQNPLVVLQNTIDFAAQVGYSQTDLALLNLLNEALQNWAQPPEGGAP